MEKVKQLAYFCTVIEVLSLNPKVIIIDAAYDCKLAVNLPIVQNDLKNCKSAKRKEEIVFTRSLIYNEFGIDAFQKNEFGRPTLTNGDLSISHSKGLYGVAYSADKKIGLDIELISEKPRRIQHKFQNEMELDFNVSDAELTRLWTLKEAVYKYLGLSGVLFAEEIWIQKNGADFLAEYKVNGQLKEKILLKSVDIDNCIVSFTL